MADMARKVTLSLDEAAWSYAEQAAARAGMSPSAWIARAARREAVRCCAPEPDPGTLDTAADAAATDEAEFTAAEEDLRAQG
jgi:hypothetical protein